MLPKPATISWVISARPTGFLLVCMAAHSLCRAQPHTAPPMTALLMPGCPRSGPSAATHSTQPEALWLPGCPQPRPSAATHSAQPMLLRTTLSTLQQGASRLSVPPPIASKSVDLEWAWQSSPFPFNPYSRGAPAIAIGARALPPAMPTATLSLSSEHCR